jgi:hypothetical protein
MLRRRERYLTGNISTSTVLSRACVCHYRRGFDWWMDLLTTYTHNSELQVITAPWLIYTPYKSLAHAKCSQSSLVVSWQRILTQQSHCNYSTHKIFLSLPHSCSSFLHRRTSNSQLNLIAISSQPPWQNSAELAAPILFFIPTLHGPNRKYRFQQKLSCYKGVFTDPLLRNGLHKPAVLLLRACSFPWERV